MFGDRTVQTDFETKLEKSIIKYKNSMRLLRSNRHQIIVLQTPLLKNPFIQPEEADVNNKKIKKCIKLKRNGEQCPSVLKKNSVYCHRHYRLIVQ